MMADALNMLAFFLAVAAGAFMTFHIPEAVHRYQLRNLRDIKESALKIAQGSLQATDELTAALGSPAGNAYSHYNAVGRFRGRELGSRPFRKSAASFLSALRRSNGLPPLQVTDAAGFLDPDLVCRSVDELVEEMDSEYSAKEWRNPKYIAFFLGSGAAACTFIASLL